MKKIAYVLLTAALALSVSAFAANKLHHKHMHHTKPAVAAPAHSAAPAARSEMPAK